MSILQSEFEEEEMSHGQIPIKEKSVRDPKDIHSGVTYHLQTIRCLWVDGLM